MDDRLKTQVDLMAALGSPIAGCIIPGHPREQIRRTIEGVGLEPTEEILEWFEWFDGFGCATTHDLFRLSEPIGLEEAANTYRGMRAVGAAAKRRVPSEPAIEEAFWARSRFPLLWRSNERIAVDLLSASPTYGAVWDVDPHAPELTRVLAPSIAAYLDVLIAQTRAGALYWDAEQGTPEARPEAEARLSELGI